MSWDELADGIGCPFDLPREEPNGFWDTVAQLEVSSLCLLKNQTYKGHCINVALMGNQIPHLHWQIVPRYKHDPRWSGPIWTTTMEELHDVRLPEVERQALVADLRIALNYG
nr:putative integron gene cassette protein [uncultured bacterium]